MSWGPDTNKGTKRARELRAEFGLGETEPVGCLLGLVEERLGVPVVLAALPDNVAGCCLTPDDRPLVIINGGHFVPRQRFTLAHEVGHLRCGHDVTEIIDTFETMHGHQTNSHEVQANAFAAELLVPAGGVEEMVDGKPSLEDAAHIAARFGVSIIVAVFRLNRLGLLTGERYEQLRAEAGDSAMNKSVWTRLGLRDVDDAIRAIGTLPRIPEALRSTALAAVLDGRASVDDAAAAAGLKPAAVLSVVGWAGARA